MATKLGDNFRYNSTQPNFERDKFTTIDDMKEVIVMDRGHLSFCEETGKTYRFKGQTTYDNTEITPDPTLGYWEEFKTGGDDVESIPNQFIESLFFVESNS